MQYLVFLPFVMIFTGVGLGYARILPAMGGWVICALGVLVGLGIAVTVFITDQSQHWVFTTIALLPFAVAMPMVINDLRYPRINDVATNVDNPPKFMRAPKATANIGRDMSFPDKNGPIVRKTYLNVQPLFLDATNDEAFQYVEKFADLQPNWEITNRDRVNHILEAEVTTTFFRFVDDIVIQVSGRASKARIDMRSKSREGLVDAGANAKRIQDCLTQLEHMHRNN